METRYMTYKNEEGQKERFYPITHKDAIVGLTLDENGNDLLGIINNHINNKNNPHELNAEDVGALSLEDAEGTVNYITLTPGFDLNNALGKYRHSQSVVVATLVNMPSEISGKSGEVVIDWYPSASDNSYGVQRLTYTNGTTRQIYYRAKQGTGWTAWDTQFLPLTGGKIKGNLYLDGNVTKYSTGDQNYIRFMKGDVSQGYLGVNGVNNPIFINGDGTTIYKLYGEHNKPTAADVGARPSTWTPTYKDVGAIGNNIFEGAGTEGTSGYVAFAQLKITSTYTNRPIEFELICRGRATPCYVSIQFLNLNGTDPGLASLKYWGTDYGVFVQKTATSTWLLYYTKSEGYDRVTVARVQEANQGITVTYPNSFATTKPTSNVTDAALGGNIGYASSAGSAATLSATLPVNKGGTGATTFTSGAALIGNGTGAVTTRAISNVTTNSTCAASTNLITANTLNYHVIKMLNRDTTVTGADTNYTSTKARGIDLLTYVPSSMINGAISLVYS